MRLDWLLGWGDFFCRREVRDREGQDLGVLPLRNSFLEVPSIEAGVKKIVRGLTGFLIAGVFALVSAASGGAQAGSFAVSQLGHQVGTASFNFVPTEGGFNSTSLVRVSMKGLEYSLSKTEELSANNGLRHVQLSALVNGAAVNVVATPDSAQLLLNVSANGRSSTARLAQHDSAIFLPDFDPGALETLLTLGVTRNGRDLWAILPKQAGTEAGSVAAIELATYADEAGTLDGAPITVHHLVATIAGARTDLFSGPANQLLQAELPQTGFALVRNGFILKPPNKPLVAPAS